MIHHLTSIGRSRRSFWLAWDTIWLGISYLIVSSSFSVFGIGPWWFTPACWGMGLLGYGVAFSCPRLTRRLTANTEFPDRYDVVSSHVAEHYPTDRLGVEQLIQLLLLQINRFVYDTLRLVILLLSALLNFLPTGNQRVYRTLSETTFRHYVLLSIDRVLRAPPVLS